MHAGGERANARDFELRKENRQGHSRENRKVKSRASGGAQSFRRIRTRGAANARGGGDRTGCAKSGTRAEDGSNIAGILHTGEDDQKGSAGGTGCADEVVERSFARLDQGRDALRVFRIGETFKETVGRAKGGETNLWPINEGSKAFTVALAGFTEEHGLDRAAGTQRFFDEAHSLDTDETAFRRQTAAQGQA